MKGKGKRPQDNEREESLCNLFGLTSTNENRIGTDAIDDHGNKYELKTTTKAGVSTARDVGLHHLEKWRNLIWICAKGEYLNTAFSFNEIYLLFPKDLEVWFCKIERKLTKTDMLFTDIISLLKQRHYNDSEIDAVQYAFQRGVLLNDPNIPWGYVRTHGTLITEDHATTLRSLVPGPITATATHKAKAATVSPWWEEEAVFSEGNK